jgi:hypothetical protein
MRVICLKVPTRNFHTAPIVEIGSEYNVIGKVSLIGKIFYLLEEDRDTFYINTLFAPVGGPDEVDLANKRKAEDERFEKLWQRILKSISEPVNQPL